MAELAGFPYFEVQFTKDGAVDDRREVDGAARAARSGEPVTDLLVIAHGWNNDMDEARELYRGFFERVRAVLDASRVPAAAGARLAVLGVLWPSKKFADKELIPSGAAGFGGAVADAVLIEQLDDLKGVFDATRRRRSARAGQGAGARARGQPRGARASSPTRPLGAARRRRRRRRGRLDDFFKLGGRARCCDALERAGAARARRRSRGAAAAPAARRRVEPAGGAAGHRQFFSGIKVGRAQRC